jgi:cellobiose-specific phosphotransferase system component IIA
MMKEGIQNGSHDLQGVYDIALSLVNLEADSDKTSMSFYLAHHFTKLPANVQLQDVLKVWEISLVIIVY